MGECESACVNACSKSPKRKTPRPATGRRVRSNSVARARDYRGTATILRVAVSVPAGLITAAAVFGAYALARAQEVRPDEARTAATVVAMIVGLFVLVLVAQPLVAWKIGLIAAMGGLFVLAMAIPCLRRFFALYIPATILAEAIAIGVAAGLVVTVVWREARRRLDRPTSTTRAQVAAAATRS